jgi:hypothetical protein
LFAQYHREMDPLQAKAVFAAFVEDLGHLAMIDIEEAIRVYRRNAKNRFTPTSGQLRELAEEAKKDRELFVAQKTGKPAGTGRHRNMTTSEILTFYGRRPEPEGFEEANVPIASDAWHKRNQLP